MTPKKNIPPRTEGEASFRPCKCPGIQHLRSPDQRKLGEEGLMIFYLMGDPVGIALTAAQLQPCKADDR